MKEVKTAGLICLRDDLDIEYRVARIEYIEREDESFSYIFTPYYAVIDLLSPPIFQGIPGLNLDLRKPQYIRENMVPVFISERSPGKNREDLWELLDGVGMTYLNQLEWLMRTELRYFGDPFYVRRITVGDDKRWVELDETRKPARSRDICKMLLDAIGQGFDIKATGYSIDDRNRKAFYSLLISLFRSEMEYARHKRRDGIRKSAAEGNYRGRQRIPIDLIKAKGVFSDFRRGQITETEALDKLGISRSTFYRRLKEFDA